MARKSKREYDQVAGLKKISRDMFSELDLRTRTSGDKKSYTRKQKHKKPYEDS